MAESCLFPRLKRRSFGLVLEIARVGDFAGVSDQLRFQWRERV